LFITFDIVRHVSAIRTIPSPVFKVVVSFVPLVSRCFNFPFNLLQNFLPYPNALSPLNEIGNLIDSQRRKAFIARPKGAASFLPGEISLVERNFSTGCTKERGSRENKRYCPLCREAMFGPPAAATRRV